MLNGSTKALEEAPAEDSQSATNPASNLGSDQTRELILDAAESLFGQFGYSYTKMAAVAKQAGVSRPLVYRYFGDKETLYRQVVSRALSQWHDYLTAVAGQSAPTTAHTIRALVSGCVGWAAQHRILRGLLLLDQDVTGRIAQQELEGGRNLLPRLLETVLKVGIDNGQVRSDLDPSAMAWVITRAMTAASLQALDKGTTDRTTSQAETLIEVVLHGVVLQPSG